MTCLWELTKLQVADSDSKKIQFQIKSKQKFFFSDLLVTIQDKCLIPGRLQISAADTLVMPESRLFISAFL